MTSKHIAKYIFAFTVQDEVHRLPAVDVPSFSTSSVVTLASVLSTSMSGSGRVVSSSGQSLSTTDLELLSSLIIVTKTRE